MRDISEQILKCSACSASLAHGVNPVVQLHPDSKILIIGQAPGRKVHESGIPWNDKSGETLREWMGVTEEQFYDPAIFSIMPMGFCYPGKGKSGDSPPRKECAKLWHSDVLEKFNVRPLIILIGQYAQRYYLKENFSGLTETVHNFQEWLPDYFVLPHPSPRNFGWRKANPWFADIVLPESRIAVRNAMLRK